MLESNMNTLPLIALDVDGVVSPISGHSHFPEPALLFWDVEDFCQAQSPGSFGLYSAKPVLEFLREIHEEGRANIKWHTSWRENAPKILGPDLNLPDWPVFEDNGAWKNSSGWWKLDPISALVKSGEKVIWVDDDINDAVVSGEISTSLIESPGLHIISPDVHVGLTKADLESIDNKLKEWGF